MKDKGQMCVLLAVAGGLLSLVPCRAVAQDAVQYQWVSIGEAAPVLYAVNTVTGESAKWAGGKWVPVTKFSLPDWDDVRKQREAGERAELERKAKEQAAVDAFCEAFSKMSLAEKVAMANRITVLKYDEEAAKVIAARPPPRLPPGALRPPQQSPLVTVERLVPSLMRQPLRDFLSLDLPPDFAAKDGAVFVAFEGMVQEGLVEVFLSSAWSDNKSFFPAPETIVEDVKAEIKRQEEANPTVQDRDPRENLRRAATRGVMILKPAKDEVDAEDN